MRSNAIVKKSTGLRLYVTSIQRLYNVATVSVSQHKNFDMECTLIQLHYSNTHKFSDTIEFDQVSIVVCVFRLHHLRFNRTVARIKYLT